MVISGSEDLIRMSESHFTAYAPDLYTSLCRVIVYSPSGYLISSCTLLTKHVEESSISTDTSRGTFVSKNNSRISGASITDTSPISIEVSRITSQKTSFIEKIEPPDVQISSFPSVL